MQTINLKSARAAIHASIAADIRRVAPALAPRSITVEIDNWKHLFDQCRYVEAAAQWDTVKRMMQEEAN